MMQTVFLSTFTRQLKEFVRDDRRIALKIFELIADIEREPTSGIGKPEPLKYGLSGYWSRRISGEHRLVYRIDEDSILFVSCQGHYTL
ncbi:MAG: hypothetical protein RI894_958 [Bacteroidota bacterium]|jgi:toxin YoeB